MKSHFTSTFFSGNRNILRSLHKNSGAIVLTANGLLQRNNDMAYPFRQDSNFWYLAGLDLPDAVLIIDNNAEYIILPKRGAHQETFDGALDISALRLQSGIDQILDFEAGWARLSGQIKRAKQVTSLIPPPEYIEAYSFYTNPARAALIGKLNQTKSGLELIDARQNLATMRMIKQKPELAAMRQAIDITVETLKDVVGQLKDYKYEYEIEADLLNGFRKKGASGSSFPSIVAAGKNACTIHYMANSGSLKNTRFVLLDVSAEVENYAADIGNTFWLAERTTREDNVYNVVLDVQSYAYSLLKPGMLMKDFEKQIEHYMGGKLQQLGLINSSEREEIRKYFPHATSHHVGLDAHDIADYDKPLQAGMVVTVEPGIYIPAEKIGVRIEHDVLITDTGIEVLSKNMPAGLS